MAGWRHSDRQTRGSHPSVPATHRAAAIVCVLLLTALLAALAFPAMAEASLIPTKNWKVQPVGTVGTGVPVVVNASGSIDGVALNIATLSLTIDGALVPRASYTASVTSDQQGTPQTASTSDLLPPGSIGDRVWLDEDADGVQDAGEPGLPATKKPPRGAASFLAPPGSAQGPPQPAGP